MSLKDGLADWKGWRNVAGPQLRLLEPIPPWMFGDSVEARNALQNCGQVHPYTCGGNRHDEAHEAYVREHGGDNGQLVAVEGGWVCPVCGYEQSLRR